MDLQHVVCGDVVDIRPSVCTSWSVVALTSLKRRSCGSDSVSSITTILQIRMTYMTGVLMYSVSLPNGLRACILWNLEQRPMECCTTKW